MQGRSEGRPTGRQTGTRNAFLALVLYCCVRVSVRAARGDVDGRHGSGATGDLNPEAPS